MVTNKEKNFISAVIYIYNQERTIFNFVKNLNKTLCENFEKYEIICVNDASTDKSVNEIKRYADTVQGSVISILNMSYYQGVELSMNAGVDLAIGDFVYEFDYPIQDYPLKLVMDVYQHSLNGYDIVSAAPLKGRRAASKLFYSVFNKVSHTQYLLRTESFRILSRRGINRVHSISRTILYRKAVYANCGLKTDVITYDNSGEKSDLDKNTFRIRKDTAIDAMILYTDIAYRFSIGFSFLLMIFTVLIGLYTVCIYIGGRPVAGWTTTMLFLSFAFLGLFIILTIVIKYMSLNLKMNFNRQKYIIESIEKLNN
ncbi:dolichol-phosphate mannosyltransferase [Hungatella effluvii]|uniref:Dolichol-phosphate mannosyltransferase n=1 Tax=Hungatella effluvii TaxID=1096246 RepID=A0A2V3Y095_9FIRM|nr:glycosyltransferase [Hungatella effluvii]PXX48945.1 dolichol-phosphate mannosyltransferase [Hungatella effluvii]